MWYFLCLVAGATLGFVLTAILTAGARTDMSTSESAARLRADALDRANGVLRRELAELRLAHEAPRDHGYGHTHG